MWFLWRERHTAGFEHEQLVFEPQTAVCMCVNVCGEPTGSALLPSAVAKRHQSTQEQGRQAAIRLALQRYADGIMAPGGRGMCRRQCCDTAALATLPVACCQAFEGAQSTSHCLSTQTSSVTCLDRGSILCLERPLAKASSPAAGPLQSCNRPLAAFHMAAPAAGVQNASHTQPHAMPCSERPQSCVMQQPPVALP